MNFGKFHLFWVAFFCCLMPLIYIGQAQKKTLSPGEINLMDSQVKGQTIHLIEIATSSPTADWKAQADYEIKGRIVNINEKIFHSGVLEKGRSIAFNLFEDVRLEAIIDHVSTGYNDIQQIRGKVTRDSLSFFTLVLKEPHILANVQLLESDRHFMIYFSEYHESHVVVETDPEKMDVKPEHPPLIPPDTG